MDSKKVGINITVTMTPDASIRDLTADEKAAKEIAGLTNKALYDSKEQEEF